MEDPIDQLAHPDTLPDSLSNETEEMLTEMMKRSRGPEERESRRSHKVTSSVCKVMREMKSDGVHVDDILEYVPVKSVNSIYYHINDECSHDRRVLLTYSECGWMRIRAHEGSPTKDIAEEYNLAPKNARVHLMGKCSHEDGIKPVEPKTLRSNAYSGTPQTTSMCPMCETEFEHPEYVERTTCSPQCNVEYASMKSAHKRAVDD